MKERKKILFCTPFDLSTGGGIPRCSHHIINYYNEQKNSEYELKLLPMDRTVYGNKGKRKNVLRFIRRMIHGLSDYTKILDNIKLELDKDSYDIVHIASSASISLYKDYLCLKELRKRKINSIIHFHFGRIPELSKINNWEWKSILKIAQLASKIIVIDTASYNTLKKHGVTNVEYLPNPLSPTVEEIIKHNHDIKRKDRTVLFVGHVIRTKGVYELAEACSSIENINLKIVGLYSDNVKNDLLEIYKRNKNISNVEFTGNIEAEKVIKEMLSCAIFCLPTYTEGFPNVILESMACGCTIITTAVGAIPEMLDIDGEKPAGICVGVGYVKELKEKIEYYLNNDNEASILGGRAKIRVNKMYSIDSVMSQLINIWKSVK